MSITTTLLLILGLATFISCLMLFINQDLFITQAKIKKARNWDNQDETNVIALDLNRKEFYKALNFMLLYGIITFDEYTQIELKALSYVRG